MGEGREPRESDVVWYIGDRHKDITASVEAGKLVPALIQPLAYGVNATAAVIEKGVGTDHIVLSYFDLHTRLRKFFAVAPQPVKKPAADFGGKIVDDVKSMIRNIGGGSGKK